MELFDSSPPKERRPSSPLADRMRPLTLDEIMGQPHLLKPGKLTSEEFEVMKQHTLIAGETLVAAVENNPSASFFRFALDIALTHHERYDGKGYPHGLAGDEIPLCGRIVTVADVYDALTTRRVYKPARPTDRATPSAS